MKCIEIDDVVIVYDRYMSTDPIKGMVKGISDLDGSLRIDFSLYNMGASNITKWNGYYFHHQQCRWPNGSVIDTPHVVSFMDEAPIKKPWTIKIEEVIEEDSSDMDILDGAEDKRTDPLYDGKIGYIPFAYHLIPRRGLAKLAAVMRCGERKGRRDFEWMDIPVEEHINHAISHLIAYMARKGGIHLANAACRVLMALDLDEAEDLPSPVYSPSSKDDLRSEGTGDGTEEGPTIPSP